MRITPERVRSFAEAYCKIILPNGFQGRFFLAGGCFKSLIHGKAPNDLDLWPASSEERASLLNSLQAQGSDIVENSQFNTILKHPALPCQVEVTCKCPPSIEECVANFDIELACIAAEYFDGIVDRVYVHAGVAECNKYQEIRAVSRLSPTMYSLRTLARLEKYSKELGFCIEAQSLRRVWDIYAAASDEGRVDLLDAAGLQREDVPEYAAIRRVFIEGRPSEPCRPFTNVELEALRRSLVPCSIEQKLPNTRRPVAIYVVGLPGAGKGTVLKEIMRDLGLSLESTVNLDMDFLRSFHGQFNRYLRGESQLAGTTDTRPKIVKIHKDLIAWFNEGSNAEQTLYRDTNSLVLRDVLCQRHDFVLPIHTLDSLDFIKFACSDPFRYVPYLVEIRVPKEVALRRTVTRAMVTGRYTPPEYVEEAMGFLTDCVPILKTFVESQDGGVVASFDNIREGGVGLGSPVRIQHEA